MSSPAAADPSSPARHVPPAPLVVLAGWLLPGLGYWLIGQRARAVTAGVTIVGLFVAGMLIGGVRAIQVPGFGESGGALYIVREEQKTNVKGQTVTVFRVAERRLGADAPSDHPVVLDFRSLLAEVGNKPWSICQVMTGPVALAGGAWSVKASRPAESEAPPATTEAEAGTSRRAEAVAPGVLSHSRINEIAVLYTAVAGMLNLLVMIDAAARADDLAAAVTGRRSGLFDLMLRTIARNLRQAGN